MYDNCELLKVSYIKPMHFFYEVQDMKKIMKGKLSENTNWKSPVLGKTRK